MSQNLRKDAVTAPLRQRKRVYNRRRRLKLMSKLKLKKIDDALKDFFAPHVELENCSLPPEKAGKRFGMKDENHRDVEGDDVLRILFSEIEDKNSQQRAIELTPR